MTRTQYTLFYDLLVRRMRTLLPHEPKEKLLERILVQCRQDCEHAGDCPNRVEAVQRHVRARFEEVWNAGPQSLAQVN